MKPPLKNEIRKPSKTLAGVTPIAVMLPPRKCKHGTCLYCPSFDVPQSYTPQSPAVMRARLLGYSPIKQVLSRLEAYKAMHHPTDKIEIIVMGGSFPQYPIDFQEKFIKNILDALNSKKSKNLEQAKEFNEKAGHRCIALCLETRPDDITPAIVQDFLRFGCTRVELGVQMPDDKIYKIVKRGHNVKDVILATRLLRDAGFKVGYHIMPGLPGSSMKRDLILFKKLFSSRDFKPDQLKIYPCQVIKGSELESLYKKGKYQTYSLEQLKIIIKQMLKIVPEYCRVMRIMREIPPSYLVSGTTRIDLRKDIDLELRKEKAKIKEIRFREIGFNQPKDINLKPKISKYKASEGTEYFLQFVNKENILFALLRLRLKNKTAIVRELHVYGKAAEIGKEGEIQHKGLGKALIEKAEELAKKNKATHLKIISGVGVRGYYRKLGYKLEGEYMVKNLS